MEVLISIVLVFILAVAATVLWGYFQFRRLVTDQENRLAALTRRVYELEHTAHPEILPQAQTEVSAPRIPFITEVVTGAITGPPAPEGVTESPGPQMETPRQPAGSKADEWEAVVGGSWLNRLGALVLVIGIALLLGYSLTQLGAAGKVAIGLGAGVSMVGLGVSLRTSDRYRAFSTSLIGGGWAAIYFTVYAAHAVEAARVIANPTLGAALLIGVSIGMILHALMYDSEQGTALAFIFSFITLNVSPLTGFSIYATLLLAFSLLVLSYLRQWFQLAVTGVVLAYATFLLRRDAPDALAQAALWIEWFAFEAFDILDLRRRGLNRGVGRSIFLLNACGFIGASLLHGWEHVGLFLFLSAAAYFASTLIRARIAPPDPDARTRVLGGGYEGALTGSVVLLAAALIERFSGTKITLALLVQAEMIFLAGYALNNPFVRRLGSAVLFVACFRFVFVDAMSGAPTRSWTPTGVLLAAAFLANRVLARRGWAYTAAAGLVIALVTEAEAPHEWLSFVWALLCLPVLLMGIYSAAPDLRKQSLLWAILTFIAGLVSVPYGSKATVPVLLTVSLFYGFEFLVRRVRPVDWFDRWAAVTYSLLGTALLTVWLFKETEGRLLTVALGVQGAALLVGGMFASERVLRLSGLSVFLLCIAKAFLYDLRQLDTFSRIVSFIVLGLLLLGASWIYTRFRERINRLF